MLIIVASCYSCIYQEPATQLFTPFERVFMGRSRWTSGAPDLRCKVAIFMGKTDVTAPRHLQQSMIVVPMDLPGVRMMRPLTVFGCVGFAVWNHS